MESLWHEGSSIGVFLGNTGVSMASICWTRVGPFYSVQGLACYVHQAGLVVCDAHLDRSELGSVDLSCDPSPREGMRRPICILSGGACAQTHHVQVALHGEGL